VEFFFQLIKVVYQAVKVFLNMVVRDPVPKSRVLFRFLDMVPDLMLDIMYVDQLDVKLVMEMLNALFHFRI
jgi:hypothetical protein